MPRSGLLMEFNCPNCQLPIPMSDSEMLPSSGTWPLNCKCGAVIEGPDKGVKVGLLTKAKRYASAIRRWHKQGRPVRTDEEVDRIFSEYCSTCHWFQDSTCTHAQCGCQVRSARGEKSTLIGLTVSNALVNKLRMATEVCPVGKWPETGQVDVLVFLTGGNPLWNLTEHFTKMGLTSATVNATDNRFYPVRRLVKKYQPRLIINRSFCIGWDVVRILAKKNPDINWLTVNHSSQPHLLTQHHWLPSQIKFAELARDLPNCWYATPDERNQFGELMGAERAIWLPNNVELPATPIDRPMGEPPTVSLVGRRDVVKNLPTQIIAAGMVNRTVPLRLLIVTKGYSDDLENLAKLIGLECECVQWGEHASYLEMIRARVDVGLQASFTESFNYVAVDHLGHGLPVVGSEAIRYLPREWQANPDDAQSIAAALVDQIRNWRARSKQARAISEVVSGRNSEAFASQIRRLL